MHGVADPHPHVLMTPRAVINKNYAGLSKRTDDTSGSATGESADCCRGKPTRRDHGPQPGDGQQAQPGQKPGGTAKGGTNSGARTRSLRSVIDTIMIAIDSASGWVRLRQQSIIPIFSAVSIF
jgi:hypothetical protein